LDTIELAEDIPAVIDEKKEIIKIENLGCERAHCEGHWLIKLLKR